ncbi:YceI family protein [Chryseobacterium hispalense]|uniref:YceI family protein n=1 Tax=Chryseobacterium hispalense TaxID=1453492 RepID=UPI003918B5C5
MQNFKWVIDPSHTKIGFSVRHFGISQTDGFFRNYSAIIHSEKEDFSDLSAHVTVQTDSIETNDSQRDTHLKAEDFFNAEKFPEMIFESTHLEPAQTANEYNMHGNLTIRDITRPVIFTLKYAGTVPQDPFGNTKAGFLISGSINRQDFGLSFNIMLGTGNLAVSDKVNINIPLELLKVQ